MNYKIGKRREPSRDRVRLLVGGGLMGVVLGRLFDPISGRRRRAQLRDTGKGFLHRRERNVRHVAAHLRGLIRHLTHLREKPKSFDDATLADKVKSELFRPESVPKGQINVNVQNGVVQLRGEVPGPELVEDLEARVRRIHGVREVENLLHPPGIDAPMHQ